MHSVNSSLGSITKIKPLTSEQKFHRIIDEIKNARHVPQDWKDHSEHPSYSYFAGSLPWLQRYEKSRARYEKQFQREFATTLEQQEKAYEAVRFVCVTWPLRRYGHLCIRNLNSNTRDESSFQWRKNTANA